MIYKTLSRKLKIEHHEPTTPYNVTVVEKFVLLFLYLSVLYNK